jgi:hypothetical protein
MVDVYLNNEIWLNDFQTLHATPFLKIPANRNTLLAVCSAQSTSSSNPIFTSFFNLPISTQIGILTGQSSNVAEPIHPLQFVWRDNARQVALESDEVDVLFFNSAIDLNSCDIRAFEPVNSTLCQNLNYGTFSSVGYISIPPYAYQFNILDSSSTNTYASVRFDATALAGNATVVLLTGAVNPEQNPDGFALGMHYASQSGGMLIPCTVTTAQETIHDNSHFTLYPNPADEVVKVQFKPGDNPKSVSIELMDAMGRLVYKAFSADMVHEIYLSEFSNGLYSLRIYGSKGSLTRSVLIAH